MRKIIKSKTLLIAVLVLIFTADEGSAFLNMQFKNFNISVGLNTVKRDIIYPEVHGYSNTKLKNSFLIDMRFDFRTFKGLRFSPNAEWWSWGEFPKKGTTGVENSMSCINFNFDINKFLFRERKFNPYIGTGIGLIFTFTESEFPPEMFKDIPIVIGINEKNFRAGINLISGFDYNINDNITIFNEFRFEYADNLNQMKFLVGISTF
ncbi:hypothetical protein ACFL4Z_01865 [candidate division KSB1 bacterium]